MFDVVIALDNVIYFDFRLDAYVYARYMVADSDLAAAGWSYSDLAGAGWTKTANSTRVRSTCFKTLPLLQEAKSFKQLRDGGYDIFKP